MELKSWLQSSQDPEQVANKVKGIILLSSSAIIFFAAQFFHLQLTAADIITLSTEIGGIAGTLWTIYGIILHIVTWFGSVRKVN